MTDVVPGTDLPLGAEQVVGACRLCPPADWEVVQTGHADRLVAVDPAADRHSGPTS